VPCADSVLKKNIHDQGFGGLSPPSPRKLRLCVCVCVRACVRACVCVCEVAAYGRRNVLAVVSTERREVDGGRCGGEESAFTRQRRRTGRAQQQHNQHAHTSIQLVDSNL